MTEALQKNRIIILVFGRDPARLSPFLSPWKIKFHRHLPLSLFLFLFLESLLGAIVRITSTKVNYEKLWKKWPVFVLYNKSCVCLQKKRIGRQRNEISLANLCICFQQIPQSFAPIDKGRTNSEWTLILKGTDRAMASLIKRFNK